MGRTISSGVYEAVVVGAGPGGISVVGNLLDRNVTPICWIDEAFVGGRIQEHYREVPGNLKARKFKDWLMSLRAFRKIVAYERTLYVDKRGLWQDFASRHPLHALDQMDPETEFPLHIAADMFQVLTRGLRNSSGVDSVNGAVTDGLVLKTGQTTQRWAISLVSSDGSDRKRLGVQTKRLILCTGSHPNTVKLPPTLRRTLSLPLDIALSPSRLSEFICGRKSGMTIAVIGGSHSAILVLRNLCNLVLCGSVNLRIRWLFRHALRYAEYEDGNYIAYDNTGLKGEAATWALENLGLDRQQNREFNDTVTRIQYERDSEQEAFARFLPGSDFVIQAIGYDRNVLPTLRMLPSGRKLTPSFDHTIGAFWDEDAFGTRDHIPGLHGAGIAFPAIIKDLKYGHVENSIGFPGFMRAIKGWIHGWISALEED